LKRVSFAAGLGRITSDDFIHAGLVPALSQAWRTRKNRDAASVTDIANSINEPFLVQFVRTTAVGRGQVVIALYRTVLAVRRDVARG